MTEQYRQITIEGYLRETRGFERLGPTVSKRLEENRGAIDRIIEAVADDFHLTPDDITGPSKKGNIVIARHVTAYLLYNSQTNMGYRDVALSLGRNDHTTTMNAIRRVEEQMDMDSDLKDRVQDLLPICSSASQ